MHKTMHSDMLSSLLWSNFSQWLCVGSMSAIQTSVIGTLDVKFSAGHARLSWWHGRNVIPIASSRTFVYV